MNIFHLDNDLRLCAEYHCDKHVVKMILELAQMLSTAHRLLDGNTDVRLYKATHKNHPVSKWVCSSKQSYEYTYKLWVELNSEYTFRYEKVHKSFGLNEILMNVPKNIIDGNIFVDPPLAMLEQYKTDNYIESYRRYYIGEKLKFSKWTKRQKPKWIPQ